MGASIQGWQHCRPVISVDGTFLKNKYLGTLLLAAALDGDNHIFPLAIAIVDSENDNSWEWFFMRLKDAIGEREVLVIVSDRKSSIPKAIGIVFPSAVHGIFMQHLLANVRSRFKTTHLDGIFYRCAKAYKRDKFEYYMRLMEATRPSIQSYLMEANYKKWARSFFDRRRYNIMTTNISECMNAILKEARGKLVVTLV